LWVTTHRKEEFADRAHHEEQPTAIESELEVLSEHGLGAMAEAMQTPLNEAMKLERSEFLRAAPGERTDDRAGYANGFKDKALRTRVGELALRVPQVRPLPGGEPLGFYPKSLERGLRSERALKLAIAEMYVQGVSTRRVTEITRELCGLDVTSTDVEGGSRAGRAAHGLARAAARPLLVPNPRRPLREGPPRRFRDRLRGAGRDGRPRRGRQADAARRLGLTLGGRGALARVHGRAAQARPRGDEAHHERRSGRAARGPARGLPEPAVAALPVPPEQNAQAYVPNAALRPQVARDLRSVFNTSERGEADERLAKLVEKYRRPAPKLAEWMEANVPEGLAVFALPEPHRRRLRTTNALERLNRELHRRTRVATLFPNEASLLRLVSAMAAEISEEWETGRIYLNPESE
jgi:transposase-like protein